MPALEAPVRDMAIMEPPLAQPDWTIEQEVERLERLDLPSEDGMPMESNWHRIAMNLLIDSVHALRRDRDDYFAGGNMFIYFSLAQVRRKNYRGPDFFVVNNTDGSRKRDSWVVWDENGRYPDVIIELASPSTMTTDLTVKKDLYEQTFHTSDYFCYDPESGGLHGWHLTNNQYQPLMPNEHGWLWCEALRVWLGDWPGEYQRVDAVWPRFYTADESLVLTLKEAETRRADTEAQRAERFAAKLRELGVNPDTLE